MNPFQDAFISYGRADSKAFAQKLNHRLVEQGLEVWFDFDDIPLGVDYQRQIDDGIEKADNFLYIIAPHSVNSPYCGKEVDLALKRNKRIIPLLHVEKIDRATWQQRFPQGTDADWETYQAKGLHSSFPNMHPEIAKINWIYCREGIDDFEAAFQQLLSLLERQKIYIRQHTQLLAKALNWERNHRQTSYLLVGEERRQAEEWLQTRFLQEQPPCVPTTLHCELITESIKNANNMMTQVFLSWSDRDRDEMEKIRQSLLRQGLTLWVSKVDIKTGADFQQEINRGIEEADNIVYLISSNSLESVYCQQEIDYACQLHKRIIPLLIKPTPLETIPEELRSLQFINFSDNTTEEHDQKDIAKLIRVINQDAAYYEEHKILLAKALKWQRQQQNPSILLRGYNLHHAEAWLKIARQREQHQPIPLITEFINQSLQQPTGIALDVFVSYSRKDSDFARRLNDALQVQGKTTWFDQESIAAGTSDFQQEIYRGIESANHFLFIISPNSIHSPYCEDEVEYAVRLNKRVLTILYQPVETAALPAGLASVQWIDFHNPQKDFVSNLGILLRALDTDPDHLRIHTRLLMQALEWDSKDRDESLLLRGNTLQRMQEWILSSEQKSPQPTILQRDYVTASNATELQRQRSALRLQRVGMGIISLISLTAVGLGLFSFRQYQEARAAQQEARQGQVLAQTQTSEALFKSNQLFEGLLEAMRAGINLEAYKITDRKLRESVVTALQQAVFWVQERQRIQGHNGIIWDVSISPNGKLLASASADHSIKLWDAEGKLLHRIDYADEQMRAVAFSADSQQLAVGADNGRVDLWQLQPREHQQLKSHNAAVTSLAFSADGKLLASASEDSTIKLWTSTGKLLKTLIGHNAAVRSVSFSPDSQLLASASDDGTIRLWKPDGTPVKTLVGHTAQVRSVSFSPDGKTLVSASWDETIRLWSRNGAALKVFPGQGTLIHDARFTPDGQMIAAATEAKTINLLNLRGDLITTLRGHTSQINSIQFNSVNGNLVSTGGDRTIRIWQLKQSLLDSLNEHRGRVYSTAFSPNGQLLASAGADNVIRLWNRQGQQIKVLSGHQGVIWSLNFSSDGQELVSGSADHTFKLWSKSGQLLRTFTGHVGAVYAVEFSPDGQMIASASDDRTVRLWRRDGTLIRTLKNFNEGLLALAFSPDGKTLAVSGWSDRARLITLEGKQLITLEGHQGWIYDISFSHDGQEIVTASYDNTARIWKKDGTLVSTMEGHRDGVVAVDFSPQDDLIATASHDNTIKLWNREGDLITTLRGHTDRVTDVRFSPDGKVLASASEDQKVLLWNLDMRGELDKLLRKGCEWSHDYLLTRPNISPEIRQFCNIKSSAQSP